MLYATTAFVGIVLGILISFFCRNEVDFFIRRKKREKTIAEKQLSEEELKTNQKLIEQFNNLMEYDGSKQ